MNTRRLDKLRRCERCRKGYRSWRATARFCSRRCSNRDNGHRTERIGMRACSACGEVKSKKWFSRSGKKRCIYNRDCIPCCLAKRNTYKASLPWYHTKIPMILCNCRIRAALRGVEFSLTRADVVIPERCPVFGTTFRDAAKGRNFAQSYAPSIDRIDSTKGYTRDNIVVVSCRANSLKSDATIDELVKISRFYQKLQHRKNIKCSAV